MFNLSRASKLKRVSNAVAAGTSDINSSSVDMTGFDSVSFIVSFGAITAGAATNCHLETSSDDTNWDDLAGSAITVADDDDNQCVFLDLHTPRERYIRCVVDRATQNSVVDGIVALQYNAHVEPVTHDASTVVGSEFHGPGAEEGTA